jgi:hypothetical protein
LLRYVKLQVFLQQPVHEPEKADEVGLASAIRADQDIKRPQSQIQMFDGFESANLHPVQFSQAVHLRFFLSGIEESPIPAPASNPISSPETPGCALG